MANGATSSDILRSILRNCGELEGGSSPYHLIALEYLNKFHLAFHSGSVMFDIDFGGVWTWAKEQDPGVLILLPAYKTGTVTVTKNSANATFGTPPAESYVGRFLKFNNRPEIFRIKNHAAPFADFEMDSVYTDSSGDLSFECFQTDYDLIPNVGQKILRLVTPMTTYRDQDSDGDGSGLIYGIDFLRFRRRFPQKYVKEGFPTHMSEIKDTDGLKRIRFNSYPNTEMRVEYDFVQIPNPLSDSDDSIPNLPVEGRNAIEYAATYKLMLDREDDRADKYLGLCQASLKAISTADRKESSNVSGTRGQLIPRPEQSMNNRRAEFY